MCRNPSERPALARLIGAGLEVCGPLHPEGKPRVEPEGRKGGLSAVRVPGQCPRSVSPCRSPRAGRGACHRVSLLVTNRRRLSLEHPHSTPAGNGQGSLCQAAGTSAVVFPFFWLYGRLGMALLPNAPALGSPGRAAPSHTALSRCRVSSDKKKKKKQWKNQLPSKPSKPLNS